MRKFLFLPPALVLTVAACLKSYSMAVEQKFLIDTWFGESTVHLLIVFMELVVACWLVSGISFSVGRGFAMVLFCVFSHFQALKRLLVMHLVGALALSWSIRF